MDLILWRHCDAEPGEPDLGRRLTSKGLRQAERVGSWLDRQLPGSCRILVSPAARAQQTAQALGRTFKTVPDIGPGASVDDVLVAANWPESRDPVLVVGHQPTLGAVAAWLMIGSAAAWSVRKGAVWWLTDRHRDGDEAILLKCVVGPEFL